MITNYDAIDMNKLKRDLWWETLIKIHLERIPFNKRVAYDGGKKKKSKEHPSMVKDQYWKLINLQERLLP